MSRQPNSLERLSLNDRIAVFVTKTTGTMWAAYAFCALSLVGLPAAIASHDAFTIVSWIILAELKRR
jgi:hypothetical protein